MSTLKYDNWLSSDGTRTFAPCTAWALFNSVGTITITSQENVSSVIDEAVGQFTVNFTVSMDNADYAISGAVGLNNVTAGSTSSSVKWNDNVSIPTVSSCRVTTVGSNYTDQDRVSVLFFGGIN